MQHTQLAPLNRVKVLFFEFLQGTIYTEYLFCYFEYLEIVLMQEKKALKEEKLKQEEKFMWAIVDGVKEKVNSLCFFWLGLEIMGFYCCI